MDTLLILVVALVIDLVLGEPHRFIHPVVWMGKVGRFLERGGAGKSRLFQLIYGAGMSLLMLGLFAGGTYFILYYIRGFSFAVYIVVGAVLLKTVFSVRELRRVAVRIKKLLLEGELDGAGTELRSLVSRDTGSLSEALVVSATVESVAENTCDSFVAPLFYFLLFGVPGAVAYRVVNTLDAMIGYHGRYEYLGKFAGRLDDLLNFIPARITALLIVLAGSLLGRGARASWRVAVGEHTATESPNAGWTMSAMAGALNVQLEKVGHYRLGRGDDPLTAETITAALKLMLISVLYWSLICFVAGVIRFVVASQT